VISDPQLMPATASLRTHLVTRCRQRCALGIVLPQEAPLGGRDALRVVQVRPPRACLCGLDCARLGEAARLAPPQRACRACFNARKACGLYLHVCLTDVSCGYSGKAALLQI
jgi:hypothetical protein